MTDKRKRDDKTAREWADSAAAGSVGPFADSATLLRRHPQLFEVSIYTPEELWRMARRGLETEALERKLDAPPFAETDMDEHAWKRCAGLRLLFPMAFLELERFIYFDFDTVAMCDVARLGALFDALEGATCFAFAGEDPSGGSWPTW